MLSSTTSATAFTGAFLSSTPPTFGWYTIGDVWNTVAPYFPLAVAGTIVWGLWLYRVILSARVKPIESDYRTTTSVIVPSYHEDPDILMRCLDTW